MINATDAMRKSKKQASTEDNGNNSLGKYIFETRLLLLTRLFVENLIELIKNDHGRAFREIEAMSELFMLVPDIYEKAIFIVIPAATISIGIRIAHINPMTDCLYLSFISRQVSIYSNCL